MARGSIIVCLYLVVFGLSGDSRASKGGQVADSPPVPYAMPEKTVPPDAKGHRVFLDPSTGDAYILFSPEDKHLIPMELHNHIDPGIQVSFDHNASTGVWTYIYILRNGVHARQPATLWLFKDFTPAMCSVKSLPSDFYSGYPELLSNPPWPRLFVAANGRNSLGVDPGKRAGPVVLESALAPGLVDVWVQGMESKILELPSEPDDETGEQLRLVLGFPYDFRGVKTLGPRLQTTPRNLNDAYMQEIQRCEREGGCSHDFSRGAHALLGSLSDQAQQAKSELDALRSTAKSSVEKSFVDVLQILSSQASHPRASLPR